MADSSGEPIVRIAELEIDTEDLDAYKALLREEIEASVKTAAGSVDALCNVAQGQAGANPHPMRSMPTRQHTRPIMTVVSLPEIQSADCRPWSNALRLVETNPMHSAKASLKSLSNRPSNTAEGPHRLALLRCSVYMRAHSTHGLWFPTGRNPEGDRRWRQGIVPKRRCPWRPTGKELLNGSARLQHAPAIGSWCSLRPPDPPLEPEDGAVHLRRPQQHPRHRPQPDRAAAAPGSEAGFRHRRQGRPRALRRHQAPGVRHRRRRRAAFGPVLRQLPLARRHADQLEDDLQLDLAPAQARRDSGRRRWPGLHQEGAPQPATASARSSTRRSAASRTWARRRT